MKTAALTLAAFLTALCLLGYLALTRREPYYPLCADADTTPCVVNVPDAVVQTGCLDPMDEHPCVTTRIGGW